MTKPRYSQEFKDEAVRLANESAKPTSQIAKELGLKESTLYNWISLSKEPTLHSAPNQSSTHLEQEVRRLKKELARVTEEREILKKANSVLCQAPIIRYQFIKEQRTQHSVSLLCQVMRVSRSGYYVWIVRPESNRSLENSFSENIKQFQCSRVYSS